MTATLRASRSASLGECDRLEDSLVARDVAGVVDPVVDVDVCPVRLAPMDGGCDG